MPQEPTVWKSRDFAELYLDGVRAAVPMGGDQIGLLLRVAKAAVPDAKHILDLGCGDVILGRALMDQYADAHGVFLV